MYLFCFLDEGAEVEDVVGKAAHGGNNGVVSGYFLVVDREPACRVVMEEDIVALRFHFIEECLFSRSIALYVKAFPFLREIESHEAVKLSFHRFAVEYIEMGESDVFRFVVFPLEFAVEHKKKRECLVAPHDFEIRYVPEHERYRGIVLGIRENSDAVVRFAIFADHAVADQMIAEAEMVEENNLLHRFLFFLAMRLWNAAGDGRSRLGRRM